MRSSDMDDSRAALLGEGQAWAPPERLEGLPPYPLADVPDIKARLLAEGRTVIDLGVGDPGLPIPSAAVEALREAVGDPALSKYGFQRGLPRYRQAVAGWLSRRFGAEVDPDLEITGPPAMLRSNFIHGIKHMPCAWTPGKA